MPTRPIHHFTGTLLLLLSALVQLTAQTAAPADGMNAALQLRGETTAAVIAGKLKPQEALNRLRAASAPMGLNLEAEAEFALAAIDIGQRLIAARKPAEAEPFFIEAEKSLGATIQKTPDAAAHDKAMFLENRAFIRSNFLNKTPEADADLVKAITLQPEDKHLQRQRDMLAAAKAGRNVDQPKNP